MIIQGIDLTATCQGAFLSTDDNVIRFACKTSPITMSLVHVQPHDKQYGSAKKWAIDNKLLTTN